MEVKRFDSSDANVFKYVFDFGDAIAEAVLYRYESFAKRTVLCISVQSGCPVGCSFCGTGKNFIRNLFGSEIVYQVTYVLEDQKITESSHSCEKFQIMFMSMGEPFLNYQNVADSIELLHANYQNAELLVSTVAPRNNENFKQFIDLSKKIDKIGLQFSIHEAFDEKRDLLIPFKSKYSLREIRDLGILWNRETSRKVYLNYCINENNQSDTDINRLKDLFSPSIFNFTFSVICSADETMKDACYRDKDKINKVAQSFIGYNVRIFDPAGQDDIGGGCGQLWYTQQWIKNRVTK